MRKIPLVTQYPLHIARYFPSLVPLPVARRYRYNHILVVLLVE